MSKTKLLLGPLLALLAVCTEVEARAEPPAAPIILVAKPSATARPAPRHPAASKPLVTSAPAPSAKAAVVAALAALKLPSSPPAAGRTAFTVSPTSIAGTPQLAWLSFVGADQVTSSDAIFGQRPGQQAVWLVLGTGAWVAGNWSVECELTGNEAFDIQIYGYDAADHVLGLSHLSVTGVGPHFLFGLSLPPGTVSATVQFWGPPGNSAIWGWRSCTFEPTK
jgi:hypothetical protein